MTRDPAGYVDGANLYENVRGNPIGFNDPMGLGVGDWVIWPWNWFGGAEDEPESPEKPKKTTPIKSINDIRNENENKALAAKYRLFADGQPGQVVVDGTIYDIAIAGLDLAEEIVEEIAIEVATGGIIGTTVRVAGKVLKVVKFSKSGKMIEATLEDGTVLKMSEEVAEKILCFVAGTLIHTDQGVNAIENIEIGDQVWAFDPNRNSWEFCEVLETSAREYEGDLVSVTALASDGSEENITSTGGHPYWVVDGQSLESRPPVAQLSTGFERSGDRSRWVEGPMPERGRFSCCCPGRPARRE